jgi:hypothetical protein
MNTSALINNLDQKESSLWLKEHEHECFEKINHTTRGQPAPAGASSWLPQHKHSGFGKIKLDDHGRPCGFHNIKTSVLIENLDHHGPSLWLTEHEHEWFE